MADGPFGELCALLSSPLSDLHVSFPVCQVEPAPHLVAQVGFLNVPHLLPTC